jgi:hypothetical protein
MSSVGWKNFSFIIFILPYKIGKSRILILNLIFISFNISTASKPLADVCRRNILLFENLFIQKYFNSRRNKIISVHGLHGKKTEYTEL